MKQASIIASSQCRVFVPNTGSCLGVARLPESVVAVVILVYGFVDTTVERKIVFIIGQASCRDIKWYMNGLSIDA